MKEITIDCSGIENPRQLHRAFAEAFPFPQWYGNNLDALHDCLTSLPEETHLTLTNFVQLGTFSNGFRRVLTDSEVKNPNLKICIL